MIRWLTAGESHGPALIATIEGLPAGATAGTLNYVDISKTHADNEMPLIINLAQGPDLPTQTPTPKPTITKKPTDGCAKQIKH